MTLQRVARAAVLLAAGAALVGILMPSPLGSGWLSSSIAVAWVLLALVALFGVRRRFFAGELLMGVLAVGPGDAFMLRALINSGPSVLDAAQAVLMAAAVVVFAVDRRTTRANVRAVVTA